jgi:hypothetical protein
MAMAKARARITAMFMATPLLSVVLRLPEQGKQSVTAITFWSFFEPSAAPSE